MGKVIGMTVVKAFGTGVRVVVGAVVGLVVIFLLALPVADWAYRRLASVDREPYVRANTRILDSLPVFPGARELARGSTGYQIENGDLGIFEKTIGYDTGIDYALPRGTRRAAIIRFYLEHMRAWQPGEVNYRDGIVDFMRGKAYVAIDASEVGMSGSARKWKLGVSVDHSQSP
jgi:hypothetical protein